jgi:hypothetical protein
MKPKHFSFNFTLREALVWVALAGLGIGIWVEHSIARDFELDTRGAVEQIAHVLMGGMSSHQ